MSVCIIFSIPYFVEVLFLFYDNYAISLLCKYKYFDSQAWFICLMAYQPL